MGVVMGDVLGISLSAAAGGASCLVVVAGAGDGAAAAESSDPAVAAAVAVAEEAEAALVEAATRCKALPSFLNLVIKFCKCNCAEGRVMFFRTASISSASKRRS